MEIIKKRKIVLPLVCFMALSLICAGTICIKNYIDHHSVKASKQSDYPIPKVPDTAISLYSYSLQELIQQSDLIIEGTVVDVIQPYSYICTPPPGSAESAILKKSGSNGYPVTIYPVKISINNTLKGIPVNNVITLYRSNITIDCEPELTIGEKKIFCLAKDDSIDDGYIIMHPYEGYFYVAADNKVYPTKVTEGLAETSGMTLDVFRRTVKGFQNK